MKKRRKVKKSVIRLTKVLLAIMMIFTTFTNMPTLVRATDEGSEQQTEVSPQEGEGTTVQEQPVQQVTPAEPAGTPEGEPTGTTEGESAGTTEGEPAGTTEGESAGTTEGESAGTTEDQSSETTEGEQPGTQVEQQEDQSMQPSTDPEVIEDGEKDTSVPTETADDKKDTNEQTPEGSPSTLPEDISNDTLENNEPAEKIADELAYEVNFETQDIMEPTKGFVGEEVEVSAMTLTREGYNFLYWFVPNEDGSETQFNPGDKFVLTEGEDKLLAKWEEAKPEEPQEETVTVMMLMNNMTNTTVKVKVEGVEGKDFVDIKYGNVDKNSYPIPGYNFVRAKTSNDGYDLNFIGEYEGSVYYANVEEDQLYSPASKLADGEYIILVYEKVGYDIVLTTEPNGTVDCPKYTVDGKGFTIKAVPDYGFTAEVKVNGTPIESKNHDGIYEVSSALAKPIDGNNSIEVSVRFIKTEKFHYWVAEPTKINWHDAIFGNISSEKKEFNSGEDIVFTISTSDGWIGGSDFFDKNGEPSNWRLNSLQINGYNLNVPKTYNQGSMNETTLPSGVEVIVECIQAPVSHKKVGFYGNTYWDPANYVYEVRVKNAKEDINLSFGNFVGSTHHEVMTHEIVGVNLEVFTGGNWTSLGSSVPTSLGRSLDFRYTIKPGYENAKITTENHENPVGIYDGNYYKFTIDNPKSNVVYLSIIANPIHYKLQYDLDGGDGNFVDDATYSISGEVGTSDKIYIKNTIPTKDNYNFGGWFINGNESQLYWPGETINLSDIIDSLTEKTITLKANWLEQDEGPEKVEYDVNTYLENEKDEYVVNKNYSKTYFGQFGQVITIINNPDAKPIARDDFKGYQLNEGKTIRSIKLNANNNNVEFYYDLIDYRITYVDLKEAENSNPETYTVLDEFKLSDPTKQGYVFMGWTTREITTPTKGIGIDKGSTGEKTFVANWEEDEDGNGIPDEYEVKVHFTVTNGKFENGEREITVVGGLKNEEDKWDKNGSYVLQADDIPQPVAADPGYTTGSWDTEPKAGTAITEETTYTYNYAKDENGDNIPDEYQAKVTYNAVNGTLSFNTVYVTLYDKDGNPSKDGVGYLTASQIPTATANSGYENGKWDVVPTEGYEITKDTVFTIRFTAIPSTDPGTTDPKPTEPVFTCPEGTIWNEATGMCEVENPAVVPPVVIDDGGDDDLPPVDEETEEVEEVEVDEEETPEVGGDEEEIVEEETPEVGGNKGSWALINLVGMLLSTLTAIILLVTGKNMRWKAISVVVALASIATFFLTQNMSLSMVLVDKWTLLMVVFFIVNAASLYMGRKANEEDDEATQA